MKYCSKIAYALFLFTILFLYGCTEDTNNQYIQGTWLNLDEHLETYVAEMHLETVWTFSGNRYWMEACCFVEVSEKGTYSILESSENYLLLELRTIAGRTGGMAMTPNTVREMEIEINTEEETLYFQRAVFSRIGD